MDKLQRIITKLESKLQPLHDENAALKTRVDDLELENELALEHIEALEHELDEAKELRGQLESLEALKLISEELEAHQRDEIAFLEAQLAALETGPSTAAAPSTDALEHELRLARLELEASQLALQAHKRGLLVVFREQVEFDLHRAQYEMAVLNSPDLQQRLEQLFDEWRLGNVGRPELSRRLEQILAQCAAALQAEPKFDPKLAREYLATINPAALDLSDRAAAKALEEPDRIEELLGEEEFDLSTANNTAAANEPPLSEEIQLKLEIASEKAAKAAALAKQLQQVQASLAQNEAINVSLASQVDALNSRLESQKDELVALQAAQVPKLDTIAYRHTLASLSESLKLLKCAPKPLILTPLAHKPRGLSAFAGSQVVQRVWEAVDSFDVPHNSSERVRQMRVLSLIDA